MAGLVTSSPSNRTRLASEAKTRSVSFTKHAAATEKRQDLSRNGLNPASTSPRIIRQSSQNKIDVAEGTPWSTIQTSQENLPGACDVALFPLMH